MCQGVFQSTLIGDQCFLKRLKLKLSTKNKQTKIFTLWTPFRGEAILIIPPDLLSLAIFHQLDCCHFLDNSHEDHHVNLQALKRKTKEEREHEKTKMKYHTSFCCKFFQRTFKGSSREQKGLKKRFLINVEINMFR